MNQPNNYNFEFSEVYDELMSEKKYEKWKLFLKELIEKYNISKDCALDIACGTGEISKILFELGFKKVIGLDKSKFMLYKAKEKLKDYGSRFEIIQDEMTNFADLNKYDLIVSFYDSINYLLKKSDVDKLLEKIDFALKPNAFAIFDMNSKEHMHISQKSPEKLFSTKTGHAKFKSSGENDFWKVEIEIIEKNNTFKEIHIERGYSSDEIKKMIENKKLNLIELISEKKQYWDKKEYLSRQYYILKKSNI